MNDWMKPLSYGGQPQSRFERLRARLGEIGYARQGVASCLGLRDADGLYPLDYRLLPKWDALLRSPGSDLSPAVRLLLLGLPEEPDLLQKTLGAEQLDFLLATGLAFRQGALVHPRLSIVPFGKLLVATDRIFMNADPESVEEGLSSDNCVWRLDRTTLMMSQTMKREKAKRVLELGCGSGALLLLTAEGAERVAGIDINPRAVNVAGFNARLNGVDNAEFVQGDLYQPVAGKRYDYIFSNPPSAPGLVRGWNREGGPAGREMVEAMLRGLEDHLAPSGVFQTTVHFGYSQVEDINVWLDGLIDTGRFTYEYAFHGPEEDSDSFALRESFYKSGTRDYGSFQTAYQSYLRGFVAAEIERVRFGLLSVMSRT